MTILLTIYIIYMIVTLTIKSDTLLDSARALHIGALSVMVYFKLIVPILNLN